MLMEKQDMLHFKVMLLLKRNHNQQQSLLTTFKKNKWLSSLISFWNMPLFMNITNNKFNNPEVYVESYVA
jgi:hypothetical protein